MNHYLKIQPKYFEDVLSRRKKFEIRYNDRNFQEGDTLILQEFNDKCQFTGRSLSAQVNYITDFQQKPGYVVLGILF